MSKVLPTTPARIHNIGGSEFETNIRQDDKGRCFLALYNDEDQPVVEVPYDASNPDASMTVFIEKLNEAVGRLPGRKGKKPAPNPSQSAAIKARVNTLKFDGSVFSE